MSKALFLYSSREGQTKKILSYIDEKLSDFEVETSNLHTVKKIDFSKYDKVLIGASIRYGHFNKKLYQFIAHYKDQLYAAKVGFFCVNLTARKESQGKDTPEGSVYIQKFLSKSPWQPTLIGVFAGALCYPHYKFFDKMMIKLIMRKTGGEKDTSKEVEYTNWEKVSFFAKKFNEL